LGNFWILCHWLASQERFTIKKKMIDRIVKIIYNPSIVLQLARLLPSKFDKPNPKPLLFYDLKNN
jgi:hypothetical protein